MFIGDLSKTTLNGLFDFGLVPIFSTALQLTQKILLVSKVVKSNSKNKNSPSFTMINSKPLIQSVFKNFLLSQNR